MSVSFQEIAAIVMSRQGTADLRRNRELVPIVADIIETGAVHHTVSKDDVAALMDMRVLERQKGGGTVGIHQKWCATIEKMTKEKKDVKGGASSESRLPHKPNKPTRISVGA